MADFYNSADELASSKQTKNYDPLWLKKVFLFLICCYPFIGARFLPLGDSGRYLSILIAPLGIFYLLFLVRQDRFSLLLKGFQRLWIWLPFFLAFGVVYAIHQTDFKWVQLFQKFIFAIILYACAFHLKVNHKQLIIAASIGAWLYFLSSVVDAWTFYNPTIFNLKFPRHLTENGIYRVGGGGGNPIHFANASMWLSGICAVGLTVLSRNKASYLEKTLVLSAAIIAFLVCLATQSRGALVALVPLFVLLTLQASAKHRKLIIGFAFISFCLAVLLATQTDFFHRLKRVFFDLYYYITEPSFIISSVSARIEMWNMTIQAWGNNITFGAGVTSIAELLELYPSQSTVHPVIFMQPHFHNDWIQSISIGGLVLLLGLLSTYLLLIYKSRKDMICLWIVIAALFFGLSDLILFQNTMLTFFISAWALFSASYDNQKYQSENSHHC